MPYLWEACAPGLEVPHERTCILVKPQPVITTFANFIAFGSRSAQKLSETSKKLGLLDRIWRALDLTFLVIRYAAIGFE